MLKSLSVIFKLELRINSLLRETEQGMGLESFSSISDFIKSSRAREGTAWKMMLQFYLHHQLRF